MSASAALLDFTKNPFSLTGTIDDVDYTIFGSPSDPTAPTGAGYAPGPTVVLAGQNDGLGISDDEISETDNKYVTIKFDSTVKITAAYFLYPFVSNDKSTKEAVEIYERSGTGGSASPTSHSQALASHAVATSRKRYKYP